MLAAGADYNIKNSKAWSAVHSAAACGHFEAVLRLVQYGAAYRGRADCDVIKMICRKSSYKWVQHRRGCAWLACHLHCPPAVPVGSLCCPLKRQQLHRCPSGARLLLGPLCGCPRQSNVSNHALCIWLMHRHQRSSMLLLQHTSAAAMMAAPSFPDTASGGGPSCTLAALPRPRGWAGWVPDPGVVLHV